MIPFRRIFSMLSLVLSAEIAEERNTHTAHGHGLLLDAAGFAPCTVRYCATVGKIQE